mgnify:FL=1
MQRTIFYLSATGNSLFVARELAKLLDEANLIPINTHTLAKMHDMEGMIGFVFPVYFCGIPMLLREFIRKLQIKPNTYIFSVATLGGGDFMSHQQIDQVLNEKQAKLSYHASIVMPGNYQLMYNTASQERQLKLFANAGKSVDAIAHDINQQKVTPLKPRKGLFARLLDSYYRKSYANHGGKDYNFHSTEACIHCELCADICPVQNIQMKDGKPVWQGKCQLCLACLHWCPKQAIQYSNKTQKKRRYHHPEVKAEDIMP